MHKFLTAISFFLIALGGFSYLYAARRESRFENVIYEAPFVAWTNFYAGSQQASSGAQDDTFLRRDLALKSLDRLTEKFLSELARGVTPAREKEVRDYLSQIELQQKLLRSDGPSPSVRYFKMVGRITVASPRAIRKGESRPVTVSLFRESEGNPLPATTPDPEMIYQDRGAVDLSPARRADGDFIQIGKHWAARLSAGGFDLSSSSPEAQPYGVDKASWSWSLSPKAGFEGRQTVSLAVEAQYREEPVPSESKEQPSGLGGRHAATPPKSKVDPVDHSYPIFQTELPVEVELGWIDWAMVKVGGLLALLAGAGLSIPVLLNKARALSEQQKPQRKIGFRE